MALSFATNNIEMLIIKHLFQRLFEHKFKMKISQASLSLN